MIGGFMFVPGLPAAPAALPLVLAEGDYTPYDQGIRHIATLAGYFSG
jgi:hypothetical protein